MAMAGPKTILLLGNYRAALALARTLHKNRYSVIVGTLGCDKSCDNSNAVSGLWAHSPLENTPDRFLEELTQFADETKDLLAIIPVAEDYVRMFAESSEKFAKFSNVVTMDDGLVKTCLNKYDMLRLARRCQVPTAPFCLSSDRGNFSAAIGKIGFPFIARPLVSTQRLDGKKALHVDGPDALNDVKFDLPNSELLLQRKFTGKRHNIYFGALDGQLVRCCHALITHNDALDDTGLAVAGITLPPQGELVEQTKRLLAALNYTGIGCAQFLVDEKTGASSFLEINPRIAGNHALPEYAGLDLGLFLLDLGLGRTPDPTPENGAAGIRYCWTSGDLMGAKIAYMKGETGLFETLKWAANALLRAPRADVHMVFDKSDPVPALQSLWRIIPRIRRWKPPIDIGATTHILSDAKSKTT